MQSEFFALSDHLNGLLAADEVLLSNYSGETSHFVRFNQSKVRQPGTVTQGDVGLHLIKGKRHLQQSLPFYAFDDDARTRFGNALKWMREQLEIVPEDPYLLYNTEVQSTERHGENSLPDVGDAVDAILTAGNGRDLVGIYAQGSIENGFANSLGQRNWFDSHSFSLDWSFYHHGDKAVKTAYAGFEWKPEEFEAKVDGAAKQLEVLGRDARDIDPGEYNVYLSPAAVNEIIGMMSWGGFGKRSHATKQTTFLKLIEGEVSLDPSVTILENTAEGVDADFNSLGYKKPDHVTLIDQGQHKDCLVSPRSAKEFECETNGADGGEGPSSVDMAAGTLAQGDVLSTLDTGVYVNNLWYLNFSDRNSFRITGMTRFATFWVEGGEIVAPLNVMRWDESVYRMFGENLVGLTADREMILSTDTYSNRGTDSARLPGAVVRNFKFTL